MFLEVMLMFLEVIQCSWRLYNVPGGYTNKGRYRAARAAKKENAMFSFIKTPEGITNLPITT